MSKILITGAAGFIGFHLTELLIKQGHIVYGIDSLNSYYDQSLKNNRVKHLSAYSNFSFSPGNICDKGQLNALFESHNFEIVINLAAQAGVRYSIDHPQEYINNNVVGFSNILEVCRQYKVFHLIYASSSSVYGNSINIPFNESNNTDQPVSLYAATKKSNEALAYSYAHLFNIPITGLRFFTVYGPWGRPDMAYFSFTRKILNQEPIPVFNNGNLERDFTYIDDITVAISKLLDHPFNVNEGKHRIYNIGNNHPVKLLEFISTLEKHIGIEARKQFLPMQDGDVLKTYADISKLEDAIGYRPQTSIDTGLKQFVNWYRQYYLI